jgi:GT2 family glycosyltransferase
MSVGRGPVQPDRLDATAIVVNHNDGPLLGAVVDRLLDEVRRVVVVDNASTDGSERGVQHRDRTSLVRSARNLGFAAGVNLGARSADGTWLILCNPDAHPQPGDVARLVADLGEDVGAIAPLQVDAVGRPKAETGGFDPTIARYLLWALVPTRWHGRHGPWLSAIPSSGDVELDWVSGALLAIRRDAFERVGGLDERFFLYHEDVELGRRLRRAGYRVVCRTSIHLFHEVAHGDPDRRVRQALLGLDSLAIDFEGWRRRALGAVLLVGFGVRAVLARGATRALGRAAIPACVAMLRGRTPSGAAARDVLTPARSGSSVPPTRAD